MDVEWAYLLEDIDIVEDDINPMEIDWEDLMDLAEDQNDDPMEVDWDAAFMEAAEDSGVEVVEGVGILDIFNELEAEIDQEDLMETAEEENDPMEEDWAVDFMEPAADENDDPMEEDWAVEFMEAAADENDDPMEEDWASDFMEAAEDSGDGGVVEGVGTFEIVHSGMDVHIPEDVPTPINFIDRYLDRNILSLGRLDLAGSEMDVDRPPRGPTNKREAKRVREGAWISLQRDMVEEMFSKRCRI